MCLVLFQSYEDGEIISDGMTQIKYIIINMWRKYKSEEAILNILNEKEQ